MHQLLFHYTACYRHTAGRCTNVMGTEAVRAFHQLMFQYTACYRHITGRCTNVMGTEAVRAFHRRSVAVP